MWSKYTMTITFETLYQLGSDYFLHRSVSSDTVDPNVAETKFSYFGVMAFLRKRWDFAYDGQNKLIDLSHVFSHVWMRNCDAL